MKKQDLIVKKAGTGVSIWIDGSNRVTKLLEETEGVTNTLRISDNHYLVSFDPRYDNDELLSLIRHSLNLHLVVEKMASMASTISKAFKTMQDKPTPMVHFTSGWYWIGDPSFAVNKKDWYAIAKKITDRMHFTQFFYYNDGFFFASPTEHGDGYYWNNHSEVCLVESGLLGVFPVEICNNLDVNKHGYVVYFDQPFTVQNNGGVFKIGHLTINTR